MGPLFTDSSTWRISISFAASLLCALVFLQTVSFAFHNVTNISAKKIPSAMQRVDSHLDEKVSESTRSEPLNNGMLTGGSRSNSNMLYLTSETTEPGHTAQSKSCESKCEASGSENLPKGIVSRTSNLETLSLNGSPLRKRKGKANMSKSLLAMAVGIKQKDVVDIIVRKFPASEFVVMLFHYDGVVNEWSNLPWSGSALHVSAINQTKWWFAKRFLHPDIVADYDYIFLWDEDLGVEHFHPGRYLSIVRREGLEISQPALDIGNSEVHHRITARWRKGDVHRRIYKSGGGRCDDKSTGPPCTGWVEMMAPVFSKASWSCVWHMIQNDLIHAWGLDMKLGYCAQGDRSKNVGVVDSEYIVHKGIQTLGASDDTKDMLESSSQHLKSTKTDTKGVHKSSVLKDRFAVRLRSYAEMKMFKKRWQNAVAEDSCWSDPYAQNSS